MAFTITGTDLSGIRKTTRLRAASAAVVATKWEREGTQGITIKDDGEAPTSLATFRDRFFRRPHVN